MCGASFYAVSVVDTTLSSFGIHIKVLQVVIEIDGTGAEVSAEQSRVGGENGGDIDLSLSAEWESNTS